jgi:predicted GNAT superfamily acetyltransferase
MLTPFPRTGDVTVDVDDTSVPALLIEIPSDLQQVVSRTPDVAATWRLATRAGFLRALRAGYHVRGLRRDLAANRAFYFLTLTGA